MGETEAPIFVVVGVGNATGTGAASARIFARAGYRVAVIARRAHSIQPIVDSIIQDGGEAAAFPVASYTHVNFLAAFTSVQLHWSNSCIRVALFNVGYRLLRPFLALSEDEIRRSLDDNIVAAFAFAREATIAFLENTLDLKGSRGTLIFTGATASVRAKEETAAFAAGKHGVRALARSLATEFGERGIHVVHAVIDGSILTDRVRQLVNDKEWEQDENRRLNPESIAKNYLSLVAQDRSAWTSELDLRPAHEQW